MPPLDRQLPNSQYRRDIVVCDRNFNIHTMTSADTTNQSQFSNSVEESSIFLTRGLLSFLKILEYLSLAAFVAAIIIAVVSLGKQIIIIWAAILFSSFIFLFLLNRKLLVDYKQLSLEMNLARKAEIYKYLLADKTTSFDNMVAPAREKALQYSQELIDDYKKVRGQARNIYYSAQLATVILSGITPILVLLDKLESAPSWLKWFPVICPATAAIVSSIVTSFPFQQQWISANATVELLEAEQEKFVLGVTKPYRCYEVKDEEKRQTKIKKSIENFIIQVNNIHLKQVQPEGQMEEEKIDLDEGNEGKKQEQSKN